jgi:hypothetical protein
MAVEVITKEDLHSFRNELMQDMNQLLTNISPPRPRHWIKSPEARKILKISPGTLQNLRVNGTLRYSKIGGIIYYRYEDIELLLETNLTKPLPLVKYKVRMDSNTAASDRSLDSKRVDMNGGGLSTEALAQEEL